MFVYYPKILYKINDFDSIKLTDINASVRIKDYVNSFRGLAVRPYVVKNGERPDIVSNKLYGSTKYEYILLLVNNIDSIYDQWQMDDTTFQNYIIKKYGSLNFAQSNIAFYYTGKGDVVTNTLSRDPGSSEPAYRYWDRLSDPNKYTETFYQYEDRLNIEKGFINVIDFQFVVQFESGVQEILQSA
jgi:hypothetical protein